VLGDSRFGVTPPGDAQYGEGSLLQDGEAHARLRRLVSKAFTARGVAGLRPRIEELAGAHVAAMVDAGPPADLVADFAAPMSVTVISELLGVAIDEREEFRQLADAASAAYLFIVVEVAATMLAWYALAGYAAGLVAAKRQMLGDDLLSALIKVRDADDGRLSDNELITLVTTIVASGYLTATNSISVGAIKLMTDPRLSELAADPDQAGSIVEEVVRMLIGLIGEPFPRWAHEDVELTGVPVRTGDLVLVRLEAANRDPRHFDDPDRFMPDRRDSPHMAFGRGPHYCLGAALARVELSAALHALATGLPGLALKGSVDDIDWMRNSVDAGPTAAHVIW
jgi:cytochrome P450